MRIKKGDTVQMIAGKDRGRSGSVLRTIPHLGKVVVEGIAIVKRHVRPRRAGEKGQRIEMPSAVDVSNVMLVCPHTKKPTRVGYVVSEGKKLRISKKSGKPIDS
ncbi:MAG: 50S ribosomal protein L24 [Candidatus Moranbacteria bacterium]|nr:50S ribosomal protein L24 [Candidatus Moranbacteria bacterium]